MDGFQVTFSLLGSLPAPKVSKTLTLTLSGSYLFAFC